MSVVLSAVLFALLVIGSVFLTQKSEVIFHIFSCLLNT